MRKEIFLKLKNKYNFFSEKFLKWFLYFFVFSLFWGKGKFLISFGKEGSLYQTLIVYPVDLLLIAAAFWFLLEIFFEGKRVFFSYFDWLFLIFFVYILFSSFRTSYLLLSLAKSLRIILIFVFYLFVKSNIRRINVQKVLLVFVLLSSLEGFLALIQFFYQKNLGLSFLGEPIFSALIPGAAKFSVGRVKFIRPPGTFPHANILASFLIAGLFALSWFYLERGIYRKKLWQKLLFSLSLFFLLGGIVVSFSRSGAIILILYLLLLFLMLFVFKKLRKEILFLIFEELLILLILAFIFSPFLLRRSQLSLKDPSISLRLIYQKIALDLIKKHPIFGVGYFNYVPFLTNNNYWPRYGLKFSFYFQPVHNIYLLTLAELGIFGFLIFVSLLSLAFVKIINLWKIRGEKLNNFLGWVFVNFLLFCFLIWGLSDHFFYDYPHAQYLFWLLIFSLNLSHYYNGKEGKNYSIAEGKHFVNIP